MRIRQSQRLDSLFTEYGTAYFNGKVHSDKRAGGVERDGHLRPSIYSLAILSYRKLTEARSWNTGLNDQ
jgi:hypothetical protein